MDDMFDSNTADEEVSCILAAMEEVSKSMSFIADRTLTTLSGGIEWGSCPRVRNVWTQLAVQT